LKEVKGRGEKNVVFFFFLNSLTRNHHSVIINANKNSSFHNTLANSHRSVPGPFRSCRVLIHSPLSSSFFWARIDYIWLFPSQSSSPGTICESILLPGTYRNGENLRENSTRLFPRWQIANLLASFHHLSPLQLALSRSL